LGDAGCIAHSAARPYNPGSDHIRESMIIRLLPFSARAVGLAAALCLMFAGWGRAQVVAPPPVVGPGAPARQPAEPAARPAPTERATPDNRLSIAAVVNDEVVSFFELFSRLRLVTAMSGIPPTPDAIRRLQSVVLRGLIDEKLQLQEAQRLGISVLDTDIDQALRNIERNNRMPAGALPEIMRRSGIPPGTLQQQIRAGIAWQRAVVRRVGGQLQVSEEDLRDVNQRLQASRGNIETLLGEIFLPVDSPELEDEVRGTAQSIHDQVRRGYPFPAAALQFSRGAAAANGGDIGWIERGQFDAQAEAAIAAVNPPNVTPPIRGVGGYYIYAVRARRQIAVAAPEQTVVEIMQLRFPIERTGARSDRDTVTQLADTVRQSINGCQDLRRVAGELRLPTPADPQRGRLSDIPAQFRQTIAALRANEASAPVVVNNVAIVFMLCSRDDSGAIPNREQLVESLQRQRFEAQARRLLRDLRRAAFIDIRV
jgi:peptidyl-prolyl cis-trans isomerase SurA